MSDNILLINDHNNRTKTGFTYYLTLNSTNLIISLKTNYIYVDLSKIPEIILLRPVTDPAFNSLCNY